MNTYPIDAPGFEGKNLELRYEGWLGSPRILEEGQPVPNEKGSSDYRLVKSDGTEVIASLRFVSFGVQPLVIIENKIYKLASPLQWWGWLWSALPLVMVTFGGLLGGAMGAVAMFLNLRVFRSDKPTGLKFAVTFAVSVLAFILWYLIGFILHLLTG